MDKIAELSGMRFRLKLSESAEKTPFQPFWEWLAVKSDMRAVLMINGFAWLLTVVNGVSFLMPALAGGMRKSFLRF